MRGTICVSRDRIGSVYPNGQEEGGGLIHFDLPYVDVSRPNASLKFSLIKTKADGGTAGSVFG